MATVPRHPPGPFGGARAPGLSARHSECAEDAGYSGISRQGEQLGADEWPPVQSAIAGIHEKSPINRPGKVRGSGRLDEQADGQGKADNHHDCAQNSLVQAGKS